jgi:hypothetical protein
MICQFCNNEFSNKQNLNAHQKRAKYCLKLQGVERVDLHTCKNCNKSFAKKYPYDRHVKTCKQNELVKELEKKNRILQEKCELLTQQLKNFREDYKDLATTAVKRPTTSTKNIQINNYIKNMSPLLESDLTDNVVNLTLDHHVKGIEGYAEYALEFPFKDKIVCVDTARNKIKYKNEDGDIIEDGGFKKMMVKLCHALKDRSFSLSQEHYEKLADSYTDREMDEFNFMETAMAITKCANGKETDFCDKIVRMISKESVVNGV